MNQPNQQTNSTGKKSNLLSKQKIIILILGICAVVLAGVYIAFSLLNGTKTVEVPLYDDDGDKTPVRSVKFYFDAQGEFTQCRWESLADWANEFTTSTESFVSLDGQTVSAEIRREYLRAVG